MSTAPTTDDTDRSDTASERPRGYQPVLVGRVAHYTDSPDELTLFPRDADEVALLTTWISASGDSWVELDEMC